MLPTFSVFIFLFGLTIGSFLNVVIYRFNTGKGVGGRSGCMTCGKALRWYELIPVFSFIVQRGKCRGCKSKLSLQYPAVELLTGLVFLMHFLSLSNQPLSANFFITSVSMLVAWCLLIVILVYDLRHKIIPDSLVYTFALIGLARVFFIVPLYPMHIFLATLLAGPVLFMPFFMLWLVSRGRWIGLGDGKLALGIGWMLGLSHGLSAVFLAFWIGAVVSIFLLVISRLKSKTSGLTMKSEIPFAPYLVLGFALVYFLAIDVIGLHGVWGI